MSEFMNLSKLRSAVVQSASVRACGFLTRMWGERDAKAFKALFEEASPDAEGRSSHHEFAPRHYEFVPLLRHEFASVGRYYGYISPPDLSFLNFFEILEKFEVRKFRIF